METIPETQATPSVEDPYRPQTYSWVVIGVGCLLILTGIIRLFYKEPDGFMFFMPLMVLLTGLLCLPQFIEFLHVRSGVLLTKNVRLATGAVLLTLGVASLPGDNPTFSYFYSVLYGAIAVWLFIDARRRRYVLGPSWASITILVGPLTAPVYLAMRPLKKGEMREGGAPLISPCFTPTPVAPCNQIAGNAW